MKVHRLFLTANLLFLLPKFIYALVIIPDCNIDGDKVYVQIENILLANKLNRSVKTSETKVFSKCGIKTDYSKKTQLNTTFDINCNHAIIEGLNVLESKSQQSILKKQDFNDAAFRFNQSLYLPSNLYYLNRNLPDVILFNFFCPNLFIVDRGKILSKTELITAIRMSIILLYQAERNIMTNNFFLNQVDNLWENIYQTYISMFLKNPNYYLPNIKSKDNLKNMMLAIGEKVIKLHEKTYLTDNYNSERNTIIKSSRLVKTDFKRYEILVVN